MKYYFVNTKFGPVSFRSYNVTEHAATGPFYIDYKRLTKKYDNIVDLFARKKLHRDRRKFERFMARIWYAYMAEAVKMMIEEGVQIPITDKGTYMAIGVNKLAPFRSDYKFNIKTMGVVYAPVIVNVRNLSRRIKYYYRIRLHSDMVARYGHILTSGKIYPVQPGEAIIQEVNEFYSNCYVKRLRNTKKYWTKKIKGYAVKL